MLEVAEEVAALKVVKAHQVTPVVLVEEVPAEILLEHLMLLLLEQPTLVEEEAELAAKVQLQHILELVAVAE